MLQRGRRGSILASRRCCVVGFAWVFVSAVVLLGRYTRVEGRGRLVGGMPWWIDGVDADGCRDVVARNKDVGVVDSDERMFL